MARMDFDLISNLNIVVGHYGGGKTNFAVNLALLLKEKFPERAVHIADLDIVNPYFRTADAAELLEKHGIEALLPQFANTNVDIPSLPPKLIGLMESKDDFTVIDVGGDDGSVALGMYREAIEKAGYSMFCVVNAYRPLITDPAAALGCMQEIEEASHLRCTAIVNNSNLGVETTAEDVANAVEYGNACAKLANLPLFCHTYIPALVPDVPELFRARGLDGEPLLAMESATKKLF